MGFRFFRNDGGAMSKLLIDKHSHHVQPVETWQHALSNVVTDPIELCQLLDLNPTQVFSAKKATDQFPLRVPRSFIERMKKGDPNDPLLAQVLPLGVEMSDVAGFSDDPLQEQAVNPVPGLLHKYHGRVLITLTGACAIHCRYCFRRHFPYPDNTNRQHHWARLCDYISSDRCIEEVILSGGDPLVLKDHHLAAFIAELEKIPHLKRLRIHTRLPIVIPERITDHFIDLLKATRLRVVVVIHCNHANEIDESVILKLESLANSNIMLLNQSVLLKGVNDHSDALINLSQTLFRANVLPYYLHMLDPVSGAAHFQVSKEEALALMKKLKQNLPGYLVPRLVQEVPKELCKVSILE